MAALGAVQPEGAGKKRRGLEAGQARRRLEEGRRVADARGKLGEERVAGRAAEHGAGTQCERDVRLLRKDSKAEL